MHFIPIATLSKLTNPTNFNPFTNWMQSSPTNNSTSLENTLKFHSLIALSLHSPDFISITVARLFILKKSLIVLISSTAPSTSVTARLTVLIPTTFRLGWVTGCERKDCGFLISAAFPTRSANCNSSDELPLFWMRSTESLTNGC